MELIKLPLNRLVALAFVEEIAATELIAVKVQFVQIKVPAAAFCTATVPLPAFIVELEIVTAPDEELFTPKQLFAPPVIMELEIVTEPVLELVIGVPLFAPPVIVIQSQMTDPLTLELVIPLPRLPLGEIKCDPLMKRKVPEPVLAAMKLCPPLTIVILHASKVIVPDPLWLTLFALTDPDETRTRFESVTDPPVTVRQCEVPGLKSVVIL